MTDFSGLAIAGRVATPNDADWDQARQAWNLAADLHPAPSPSSRAATTSPRWSASPPGTS